MQDCCSELEALGAGAPHAQTKADKESQIDRDVPRTSYKIMGEQFGCAMGENADGNIREKLVSEGRNMLRCSPLGQSLDLYGAKGHWTDIEAQN